MESLSFEPDPASALVHFPLTGDETTNEGAESHSKPRNKELRNSQPGSPGYKVRSVLAID